MLVQTLNCGFIIPAMGFSSPFWWMLYDPLNTIIVLPKRRTRRWGAFSAIS